MKDLSSRFSNWKAINQEKLDKIKNNKSDDFLLKNGWIKNSEYIYIRKKKIDINNCDYSSIFKSVKNGLIKKEIIPEKFMFFDTETTGLSGGAGNYMFLLGLGYFKKKEFIIEQIFLADFPGEPDLIEYLVKKFSIDLLYISYNGKSFDTHILKTRFLLNGMNLELPEQLDLLHFSRRLWKNLIGSCSLGAIEEKILDIHRINDVSGFEVPDIYLNFLRYGTPDRLELVFEHNFQDILSLLHLYLLIQEIFISNTRKIEFDKTSLGIYLLNKNIKKAVVLLTEAFEDGDEKAGSFLGNYYKHIKEWKSALCIWKEMANKKSSYSYLELAKYYEHKKKDFETSYEWTLKLKDSIRMKKRFIIGSKNIYVSDDIEKRLNRLRRKMNKLE